MTIAGPELVGGAHLARTYSRDPSDFPEPNSRQEIWRFAALPRLRTLFGAPPADGSVDHAWSPDAPISYIGMDDTRVGSVLTPFDRIAAVAKQDRANGLRRQVAGYQREVAANDGVGVELPAELALGERRAGEDDEAARLLVDAVHDPQPRQRRDR